MPLPPSNQILARGPARAMQPGLTSSGNRLPALKMSMSSRVERHQLPSFLVVNKCLGRSLNLVVTDFVQVLQSAASPGALHLGMAWEATYDVSTTQTIRVAHSLKPGHSLAVDVTLRAQGDDLYVQFRLIAKTLIARLHSVLLAVCFCVLWTGLYSVFLLTTDSHYALGQSFAQKYFSGDPQAGVAVMVLGWDVDARPGATSPYKRVPPWTVSDYFLADPVLFFQSLATIPAMIAGLVLSILLLIPRESLRYPCLWLGWPTPDDFDSALMAHKGWVERLLYQTLEMRYGVTKSDLIEVPQR